MVITAGVLSGCGPKTVQVLDYNEGNKLAAEYKRSYNPRKKQEFWVGPTANVSHLRRANPTNAAIILGQVNIIEPNPNLPHRPGAGTGISIDKKLLFADASGFYSQEVSAGRHKIWASGVGFLRSYAPTLRVERGDSLQVDFRILPDFRPLH